MSEHGSFFRYLKVEKPLDSLCFIVSSRQFGAQTNIINLSSYSLYVVPTTQLHTLRSGFARSNLIRMFKLRAGVERGSGRQTRRGSSQRRIMNFGKIFLSATLNLDNALIVFAYHQYVSHVTMNTLEFGIQFFSSEVYKLKQHYGTYFYLFPSTILENILALNNNRRHVQYSEH